MTNSFFEGKCNFRLTNQMDHHLYGAYSRWLVLVFGGNSIGYHSLPSSLVLHDVGERVLSHIRHAMETHVLYDSMPT